MSPQGKLLETLQQYRWPFFILWTMLFRLPHILGADRRLDGDGAHHWLVMDRIYRGEAFVLHPHGMDHIGLGEFLLAAPFVPRVGHTQFAYQLGLCVVFWLTAWPLFLFARRAYGRAAASWTLLLLALAHPFVQFISLRPYGGHLLCNALGLLVLYLWWRRVAMRDTSNTPMASGSRDTLYWLGTGALAGIALYTNRLYLILFAAHLGGWSLHALTRRDARCFGALLIFGLGFALGGTPQWLGSYFEPFAPNYPNASFQPGLENLQANATVFVSTLLPNLLDILNLDVFSEAGFVPPGDVKKLVPVWQLFLVLAAVPVLLRLIPRGIQYLLGRANLTVGVLAVAVIAANTLAILITELPIWGFSARYLLGSVLILVPIYAAFAAGLYDAPALAADAQASAEPNLARRALAFLRKAYAGFRRRAPRIFAVGHLDRALSGDGPRAQSRNRSGRARRPRRSPLRDRPPLYDCGRAQRGGGQDLATGRGRIAGAGRHQPRANCRLGDSARRAK